MEVVIVQRRLTHYRTSFFDTLRSYLSEAGIKLRLIHGQPSSLELFKKDFGVLNWSEQIDNHYWQVWGKTLCWQSLSAIIGNPDLIVITQENSLLSNYPILLKRCLGGSKVAFWGHGANLQSSNPNSIRERFKRWTTSYVDWWFAYTALSVELVQHCGFPPNRITNLENAVDTTAIRDELASIGADELIQLRRCLGLDGAQVALYLGSLYEEKRLDFLFAAANRLHTTEPSFRLLIVGDGPQRKEVELFCSRQPWCLYVGAKTGREKARHLALADVIMNPGMVGLGILDSFSSQVPMVTTNCALHSPEIAYLEQHINGVITENTLEDYVEGVCRVLLDGPYRARLKEGCRLSATRYTVENMAKNFHEGIHSALMV